MRPKCRRATRFIGVAGGSPLCGHAKFAYAVQKLPMRWRSRYRHSFSLSCHRTACADLLRPRPRQERHSCDLLLEVAQTPADQRRVDHNVPSVGVDSAALGGRGGLRAEIQKHEICTEALCLTPGRLSGNRDGPRGGPVRLRRPLVRVGTEGQRRRPGGHCRERFQYPGCQLRARSVCVAA